MARKRKAAELLSPRRRSPRKPPQRPYVYDTLLEDEIRVLVLSPGMPDDPLHGALETLSTNERPRYKAISYAWGDPVFPHTLYLPQGQLYITESLHGALRRFRDELKPVRLWADAVCIAQNTVREKNHQVSIMDQIFERAEEVLIWLGEALESDCLASFALRIMDSDELGLAWGGVSLEMVEENQKFVSELFQSFPSSAVDVLCPHCRSLVESPAQDLFNVLGLFWARPWFSRLWVIQEAALAASKTFFYGSHSIAAHSLYRAAQNYDGLFPSSTRSRPCTYLTQAEAVHFAQLFSLIDSTERSKERPTRCSRLLYTIFNTQRSLAFEPRDRVYAIRRLAGAQGVDTLLPDYGLKLVELWKRVTIVELTIASYWPLASSDFQCHSPILALALLGTQGVARLQGQPSWVPNYGKLTQGCARKYEFHEHESRKNWAGSQSNIEAVVDEQKSLLQLQGKVLYPLERLCERSQLPNVVYTASEQSSTRIEVGMFPWYLKCHQFVAACAEGYHAHNEGLRRLLLHGCELPDKEGPSFDQFECAFDTWRAARNPPKDLEVDTFQMYKDLNVLMAWDNDHNWNIDNTRILANTLDGHIGWVPETSQPGDLVTLFQGSPFPFILRERGDGYHTVIGDAYIDGIMHGEAWPEDGEGVTMIGMK